MTMEEILKDWKDNEELVTGLFKILLVNKGQIFPLFSNKFYMQDYDYPKNSRAYWFTKGELYGFTYSTGRVTPVDVVVPWDWEAMVMRKHFYGRD